MIKKEAVYVCDVCGKEIKNDLYSTDLVTVTYEEFCGNQWDFDIRRKEKHVHNLCLKNLKI